MVVVYRLVCVGCCVLVVDFCVLCFVFWFVVSCVLGIVCGVWFVGLLFDVCCVSFVGCCVFAVVSWLLCFVCCLWFAISCVLPLVHYLMCVGCRCLGCCVFVTGVCVLC